MRLRLRTTLTVTLFVCGGLALGSALGGTSLAGETVTVSVPQPTSTTLVVAVGASAAAVEAARSDPARIAAVSDPRLRRTLTAELRDLDSFIAIRPKLQPYRTHLWFVAHHSSLHLRARQVAALLWCAVWFPHDCGNR
jgi:hypothetical protein